MNEFLKKLFEEAGKAGLMAAFVLEEESFEAMARRGDYQVQLQRHLGLGFRAMADGAAMLHQAFDERRWASW